MRWGIRALDKDINITEDDLLKIQEEILCVAKTSAAQEENRLNILLKKSDFLMKYISATFVIINAICVFIATNTDIAPFLIFLYYVINGMLLLLSTYHTINAQTLVKSYFFPSGQDILNGIKKEISSLCLIKVKTDTIKYYTDYTNSLKESNDNRANKLNNAYKCFILGTVSITVGFLLLILFIA